MDSSRKRRRKDSPPARRTADTAPYTRPRAGASNPTTTAPAPTPARAVTVGATATTSADPWAIFESSPSPIPPVPVLQPTDLTDSVAYCSPNDSLSPVTPNVVPAHYFGGPIHANVYGYTTNNSPGAMMEAANSYYPPTVSHPPVGRVDICQERPAESVTHPMTGPFPGHHFYQEDQGFDLPQYTQYNSSSCFPSQLLSRTDQQVFSGYVPPHVGQLPARPRLPSPVAVPRRHTGSFDPNNSYIAGEWAPQQALPSFEQHHRRLSDSFSPQPGQPVRQGGPMSLALRPRQRSDPQQLSPSCDIARSVRTERSRNSRRQQSSSRRASRQSSRRASTQLEGPGSIEPKKRFPCPKAKEFNCEEGYTTSGHATRHARIHTNETFPCPYPGCKAKPFTRKDNMKQHYKQKHGS